MRIGLFTDTYYPRQNGVAISVLMLRENLEAQGHEVYVFTTTDPDASEFEHNVVRVPSIPFRTQRLGTFISPVLRRRARRLGLDIIHTHTEYTLGSFGRILARQLDVPYVHTMHTIYEYYTNYIIRSDRFKSTARSVARRLTTSFCNSADLVIAPTVKIEDMLMSYGVVVPMRVIPSGIQLENFGDDRSDYDKIQAIRDELGLKQGEKVLLNVGRVAFEKNLDELFTGLQKYLFMHPDVKLVIVGDGLARAQLAKLAEVLELQPQVVFAGTHPWDEINQYYRLGDLFIGASQSETQGLTYIEAMASGLPIVAKEDRCLDGVLENGINGFFFKGANDMVTAVDKLLSDNEVLKTFSQNAIDTAKRFSAGSYAYQIAATYAELKKVKHVRRDAG